MRNIIQSVVFCGAICLLFNCSSKEKPIYCLSDEYSVVSKAPVLKLTDEKFPSEAEGSALVVLSITDSLTIREWDLLSLSLVNKSKGDTLINYSVIGEILSSNPVEKYKGEIDAFVNQLQISLKEGISQARSRKIQINVEVKSN